MNVEIRTEAKRNSFSGNICFEFSVASLQCSIQELMLPGVEDGLLGSLARA
jgi:hypothetical protein